MMKIMTIVGARPQFVKAAGVSRLLRQTEGVREILVHTGQHYDANMSDIFFQELELSPPDYHLGIGSAPQGEQTGKMLEAIESVCLKEHPDCLLVYGDTNSTLAGALAAAKLSIPVAHVEAGLRSFNRRMPEEINRIVTDHVSDYLFTPTAGATKQLLTEGVAAKKIHQIGDVMHDVSIYFGEKASQQSQLLEKLQLKPKTYGLATIHRAENTDDPIRLMAIFKALSNISREWPIVLPLHPRTKKYLAHYQIDITAQPNLKVIEPVGFLDMLQLEKNAKVVVTDSGGVQKEAYFYHVPCVTVREETEWQELVDCGWNRLATPHDSECIEEMIMRAISSAGGRSEQLYGNGDSCQRLLDALLVEIMNK